jgi:methionine-rich copper-binding protein CopC
LTRRVEGVILEKENMERSLNMETRLRNVKDVEIVRSKNQYIEDGSYFTDFHVTCADGSTFRLELASDNRLTIRERL